jgi:ubiquinone/menaquinone biosynthesis C-methylase UbiE
LPQVYAFLHQEILPVDNCGFGTKLKDMKLDPSRISRVNRPSAAARRSYNKLARFYDTLAGASERKYVLLGLQKLNVRKGERVLEIGFGTGHALVELARRVGEHGKVSGIDISDEMLKLSARRLDSKGLSKRVELVRADAASLPYPDGCFDALFMAFTLELFDTPDIERVLLECRRVLSGKGRLGVVAMSKRGSNPVVRLYERAHERFPVYVDCRPIYVRESLQAAGFGIIESTITYMWGFPVEITVAASR